MGAKEAKEIRTYRQKRKSDLIYIMGGKCQLCGYDKNEAALEFHHCNPDEKKFGLSNGNCRSLDKDLAEARKCILLCANCHREVTQNKIPVFPSFNEERALEVIQRNTNARTPNKCIDCGAVIGKKALRCERCAYLAARRAERPTREELKNLIRNKSFLEIGRMFNVTDNAIRKWCKSMNLPFRKADIKNYSDKDWKEI